MRALFSCFWSGSHSLTVIFLLMLLTLVGNLAGLVLDHRLITGAPAWLKPAKFAISVAIFAGTLAWTMRFLTQYPRQSRWAARVISLCLFIEIAIIDLQAARGTSSHFNYRTIFDGILFGIMATAILILWFGTIWIAILLFRQSFANQPLGWALRLGMLITVFGAVSGGLMTRPTPSQKASFERERPAVIGAHTVGGPDGGPGLPGVKWSTRHGDLRIPHFFGLHGLQVIPLFYALFIRRRPQQSQTRLVMVSAASYAAFALLLGWQALRGQSIVQPDSNMVLVLSLWAILSCAGVLLVFVSAKKLYVA